MFFQNHTMPHAGVFGPGCSGFQISSEVQTDAIDYERPACQRLASKDVPCRRVQPDEFTDRAVRDRAFHGCRLRREPDGADACGQD